MFTTTYWHFIEEHLLSVQFTTCMHSRSIQMTWEIAADNSHLVRLYLFLWGPWSHRRSSVRPFMGAFFAHFALESLNWSLKSACTRLKEVVMSSLRPSFPSLSLSFAPPSFSLEPPSSLDRFRITTRTHDFGNNQFNGIHRNLGKPNLGRRGVISDDWPLSRGAVKVKSASRGGGPLICFWGSRFELWQCLPVS